MRVLTVSLLLSLPMVMAAQAQIAYDPLIPLTSEQKAARRVKQVISPMNQLGVAVSSAVGQWSDVPHAWGQGAEGYARRFGSAEGIVATNNAIGLTSDIVFHIDPRYRRMPEAGTKARVWNAVSQTFLAYRDSGGRMINVSEIGASYGSAFVANTWQPSDYDSSGDALLRGTLSLAFHTGKNLAGEFLPDILHRFRHPRHTDDAPLTKP